MNITPKLLSCSMLAMAALALTSTNLLAQDPAPTPAPDPTSITNLAGNWYVNGGTATTSKRGATDWIGRMAIDSAGNISGNVNISTFPVNRVRSSQKDYTINNSRIFGPLKKVTEFVNTDTYTDSEEDYDFDEQKSVIVNYVYVTTKTNGTYQADFHLRTSQKGVEGKGLARIVQVNSSTVETKTIGTNPPTVKTNTESNVYTDGISGSLFGPGNHLGDFYLNKDHQ